MGNHLMLVIGAGVIFYTAVLSINRTMLRNSEVITESGVLLTASTIGEEIIEEAQGKLFDEALSLPFSADLPDCFTAPDSLGTEDNEDYPSFDDVDDYNNLIKVVSTPVGNCSLVVKVGYVDSVNVDEWVQEKSFYKKMEVEVYNNFIPEPVKLSYLFCYHK